MPIKQNDSTYPIFIEAPEASERSCIYVCVCDNNLASDSTIFRSDFGTILTVRYFWIFSLLQLNRY